MGRYLFFILVMILTSGMIAIAGAVPAQTLPDGNSSDAGEQTTAAVSPYKKGITTGRARALAGGFIGLLSLVVGWRAKRHSINDHPKRNLAIAALSLGAISVIFSVVHLMASAGAVFGSGSGKAGAIVALIPSLGGIILGLSVLRKYK